MNNFLDARELGQNTHIDAGLGCAVIRDDFVEPLNPWFGKAAILGIIAAIMVNRAPFGSQSRKIPIAANHRGGRESFVLALAWLGSMILPLLWVFSPLFAVPEYPLNPV